MLTAQCEYSQITTDPQSYDNEGTRSAALRPAELLMHIFSRNSASGSRNTPNLEQSYGSLKLIHGLFTQRLHTMKCSMFSETVLEWKQLVH